VLHVKSNAAYKRMKFHQNGNTKQLPARNNSSETSLDISIILLQWCSIFIPNKCTGWKAFFYISVKRTVFN
jgi:hypothetical protein